MLSSRGVSVALTGLAMWLAARLIGSPGLEVVSIGIGVLPFLSALALRLNRKDLEVRRRPSESRVTPGTRVTVSVDVRNRSTRRTPTLLVEDLIPPALGRPARLVVSGIGGRATQHLSYPLLPQQRGRFSLGPMRIDVSDAFALSRSRLRIDHRDELLVTPEIEDLARPSDAASGSGFGAARARQLLRTGEDYFTMRSFQEGDDLRLIHWPSVARTGELMIRQNETSRRAAGVVFVDTREGAIGRAHEPAFERVVSCAASVGVLMARSGFILRLATTEAPSATLTEDRFLDALAALAQTRAPSISPALTHLRSAASPETSLVFVAAPPNERELPSVSRVGSGFGPKMAILVHPVDPLTVPPARAKQLEARATQATLVLGRAGWDCIVLSPGQKLSERWHVPRDRRLVSSA
jgi:uncharacterized protein (DUF58 family)